jgi:ABC-type transport system substrate-binding protein
MARASSWDPPVIDPRLTQSVGTFQFAGLVYNRLLRYRFADEAAGTNDLTLVGDLAESWEANPEHRVWTFKIRQGVKWQNVPPLNGRELVAADLKYCYEAYARKGCSRSPSVRSRRSTRRTSTRCVSISRRRTCCSPTISRSRWR